MRLVQVPLRALDDYLQGRQRDPRVTYYTGIPEGKSYPVIGKRQRKRKARQLARIQSRSSSTDGGTVLAA